MAKAKTKAASEKEALAGMMKKTAAKAKKEPKPTNQQGGKNVVIRSVSLSPAADVAMKQLGADLTLKVGRHVSASSVVRALLERCTRDAKLLAQVTRAIEAELNEGVFCRGRRH